MIIHLLKTKEIVFRRPNPKLIIYPSPLEHFERVSNAKLLGVTLNENLRFDVHVNNITKMCSQRFYLLKLLRDQGMPKKHLNTTSLKLDNEHSSRKGEEQKKTTFCSSSRMSTMSGVIVLYLLSAQVLQPNPSAEFFFKFRLADKKIQLIFGLAEYSRNLRNSAGIWLTNDKFG